MKVIIAGTRLGCPYKLLCDVIDDSGFEITEVVSGTAKGVDRLGEYWAAQHGIPIKQFYPDWGAGKKAGIVRNMHMGTYADALIAIPSISESKGTYHMISYMIGRHKPVHYVEVP